MIQGEALSLPRGLLARPRTGQASPRRTRQRGPLPLSMLSLSRTLPSPGLPGAEPAATDRGRGTVPVGPPIGPWRRTTGDREWGSVPFVRGPAETGHATADSSLRGGVPRLHSDGRPHHGHRSPRLAGAGAHTSRRAVSERGFLCPFGRVARLFQISTKALPYPERLQPLILAGSSTSSLAAAGRRSRTVVLPGAAS